MSAALTQNNKSSRRMSDAVQKKKWKKDKECDENQ